MLPGFSHGPLLGSAAGGGGGGGGDPLWASVVLQIQPNDTDGSTTFVDEKNGRTITAVGNAQINNNEILLDGAGDALTLANHADWDLGGNFCVDAWATFESLTTIQAILSHYSSASQRGYSLAFDGVASPKQLNAALWSSVTDPAAVTVNTGNFTPTDTSTRHALRWDRASSVLRIFVDGVLIVSGANNRPTISNDVLAIGRVNSATPAQFMTGRIKALRFTQASRHGSDTNYTPETLPLLTS